MLRLISMVIFFSFISSEVVAEDISRAFAPKNQVKAGLYFKIPFNGRVPHKKAKSFSYGFNMGYLRDYKMGVGFQNQRVSFKADLIRADFKSFGFNKLTFAGQDVLHYEPNRLGFLTKQNGQISWTKVGLFVAGAGLATWGLIEILDNEEQPDIN